MTVFGGSGFIGWRLIPRLTDAGATVVVGARHPDAVDRDGLASDPARVKPMAVSILLDGDVRSAVESGPRLSRKLRHPPGNAAIGQQ